MAETTMATMAEMVGGRNVLWPNRSVDETSRKLSISAAAARQSCSSFVSRCGDFFTRFVISYAVSSALRSASFYLILSAHARLSKCP
jgi:hypothetical protein